MDDEQNGRNRQSEDPKADRSAPTDPFFAARTITLCRLYLVCSAICSIATIAFSYALIGVLAILLSVLALVRIRQIKPLDEDLARRKESTRILAIVLLAVSAVLTALSIIVVFVVAPLLMGYVESVAPSFNLSTLFDAQPGSDGSSVWG